ncbi:hypothetical protein PT974_04387 [Cladobotryum mycophilum]|uniref:Uncharacterized protein n=1 Tax=Cladobotryum mycophilum TaxID=491253 RepID=A0ABR0SUY7_9HYPO
MALETQRNVSNAGISIMNETSPAVVVYGSKLWVFYNGSGNDGIWYTRYDGNAWEFCQSMKSYLKDLNIRKGSSPCPVVHNNKLYVFWSNATRDGIQYTVWNGQRFEGIFDIGVLAGQGVALADHTNPAVASFEGKLHVFWNGVGRDGIYFTTSNGNNDWLKQQNCSSIVGGIGILQGTSPALAVFDGAMYVFYQGSGKDGTWYFTRSGNSWSSIVSIQKRIGGNGMLVDTSPAAFALTATDRLVLLWTGAGKDGVWYSQFGDNKWYGQQSILKAIKSQGLPSKSNCAAVEFLGEPYVFWVGLETGLWYTTRKVYDLAKDELEIYTHLIRQDVAELHLKWTLEDANLHRALHNELIALANSETAITMTTPAGWESAYPNARMLLPGLTQNRLALIRILAEFTVKMTGIIATSMLGWQYVSSWSNVQQQAISKGYNVKTTITNKDGSTITTVFEAATGNQNGVNLPEKNGEEM